MHDTKDKILDAAHSLFTIDGVASVSLRQIAKAIGISHSNLRYHFRDKSEIIAGLHERLLSIALKRNAVFQKESNPILALIETNYYGFQDLYQYRFLMIDFALIMRSYPEVQKRIGAVKVLRQNMYQEAFRALIKQKQMRPEAYPNEHANLIEVIGIYSDFWISAAEIYDKQGRNEAIVKYMRLFISLLYPHLTAKGQRLVRPALDNTQWWDRFQ